MGRPVIVGGFCWAILRKRALNKMKYKTFFFFFLYRVQGVIQEKVTSKLMGNDVSQNWSLPRRSAEGKLQCIDVVRQEWIGESDCSLLSFTIVLGG